MSAKVPENSDKPSAIRADARQRRSAEALRANLRRRKSQERDRADSPGETEGPADSPAIPPPSKSSDTA